jgi:hypothetical protein
MQKPYTYRQIRELLSAQEKEVLSRLPKPPGNGMAWDTTINGGIGLDISGGHYSLYELKELNEVLTEFFDD